VIQKEMNTEVQLADKMMVNEIVRKTYAEDMKLVNVFISLNMFCTTLLFVK